MSVFISWSGDDESYAAQIGTALKRFYEDVFSGLKVYHSRHDRKLGPWYSVLEDELRLSQVCICVLTRQALTSLWMPFEVGEIKAAGKKHSSLIAPILFGIKESEVKGPFREENYFSFSYENIFKLSSDINDLLGLGLKKVKLTGACQVHFRVLEDTVSAIVQEMKNEYEAKRPQETILSFASDYLAEHVSRRVMGRYLRDYLLGLGHDELAPVLAGISRDMSACIEQASSDDDESNWNTVWSKYAFENLIELATRLNRISHGEIPLTSPEDGRDFWKNVIMVHAASVQATNIASFGASFGRRSDSVLLEAQRRATGSGVNITRIFIYSEMEGERTSQESLRLRELMAEQIEAGIRVFVISEKKFNDKKRGLVDQIGSSDFMILDGKYLYLTKYKDKGTEIAGTEFMKDPYRVDRAVMLYKLILEYGKSMDAEKVKIFPDFTRQE